MIARIASLFLAACLLSATANAGDYAPLAPGKPSGVAAAQDTRQTILLIGGGLVIVTGFAFLIAATQHEKNTPLSISGGSPVLGTGGTTTTTTTTS